MSIPGLIMYPHSALDTFKASRAAPEVGWQW